MEGSLSFDPNNAIFTQNIHEDTGCVINYIRPTSVQNWLKNKFFKKGLVYFEFMLSLYKFKIDQPLFKELISVEFSFNDRFVST